MTLTFEAHSDGKVIVPDEPRALPVNARLRVQIEVLPESGIERTSQRIPINLDVDQVRAIVENPQHSWQPLDIRIDSELAHAIALDPEFDLCNVDLEEFLADVKAASFAKGHAVVDRSPDALKWPLLRAAQE